MSTPSPNMEKLLADLLRNVADDPSSPHPWASLASLARQGGNLADAFAMIERAKALSPDNQQGEHNYANLLLQAGRYTEAASIRAKLAQQGDAVSAALHIAALRRARLLDEAVSVSRNYLAKAPDNPEISFEAALAALTQCDFATGWPLFAKRWHAMGAKGLVGAPMWDGSAGKEPIAILTEQGLGDAIAGARYLEAIIARRPNTTFVTREALLPIMQAALPDVRVVSNTNGLQVDAAMPLLDTPAVLGLSTPPPPLTLETPQMHAEDGRFNIGIVWSGASLDPLNETRPFNPEHCLSFAAIPGVRLFSLQKGEVVPRRPAFDLLVKDLGSADRSPADAMRNVAAMDLIITCDTMMAHLAGSMGVNVWLAAPFDAHWWWGNAATTTPWYPNIEIFRQPRPFAWDAVFAAMRRRLLTQQDVAITQPYPIRNIGDLLDRASIRALKDQRIQGIQRLQETQELLMEASLIQQSDPALGILRTEIDAVNATLWDLEERMRLALKEGQDSEIASISRAVVSGNQDRSRLKRKADLIGGNGVTEVKSDGWMGDG